jgi:4-hydroxy-2-oxoheptanedioate aldolase
VARDPTGVRPDFVGSLIAAAVAEDMRMKKNLLKEKLINGEIASGVLILDPVPQIVEVLALLGFDWLFIDCEHSSLSLSEVGQLVLAAAARDMTPLVRVPRNSPEVILPYLDAGAMGIIIPGVESVEDCRVAVRGAKYAPEGVRGLAPARSADYGLRGPLGEYVKAANRETLVLAVAESREGVENIEGILGTDGIDGVVIGSTDLSQSLGSPGQTTHPVVVEAANRILAAGKKVGKPIGGVIRSGETPQQYIENGYQLLLTSVYNLLIGAGKQFLGSMRA